MLECGKNFRGSIKDNCNECHAPDDENHRLNHCIKFRDTNFYDCTTKVPFESIHSRDPIELRKIIPEIMKVWNLSNANGTMKI